MVAELLTLVDIGDVNLYHRSLEGADAVLQGNARVGVGTGVEHYSVATETYLLQFVYQLTLNVALVVANLNVRIEAAQLLKV